MRLRTLAPGHILEPYLNFIADVTEAQHRIQGGLPEAVLPASSQITQALEYGIPPLSRATLEPGDTGEVTVNRLLESLGQSSMPKEASAAIESLAASSCERLDQLMGGALKHAPADNVAERVLILAALQVHFSRLAVKLSALDLRPVADGVCPACASPPHITRAFALARYAARCGMWCASNACFAAQLKASAINPSKAARKR
jgi:FdhE protein